ncbi:alpha/beta hydrolase [Pseudomonas matsuisoli]|uniref:Alpha/beta hydrolase n=1 Tax=Pseudomonas matsuisoli TaxID=1515666 RepID=A0A917PUP4_9PSED|nr:alpha/beta hydrolase [Pseudomonas matsuisoli]GGJ92752.1 alpha/beta hydrolase [Pseudomonas matsuisoli]
MSALFLNLRKRWLSLSFLVALVIGWPVGCAKLEQTERELVFRIEPGIASWYTGLPAGVEELDLSVPTFGADESLYAWWWPAEDKDAPTLLYLHGSRWNLTGQLFRIQELRRLGFSILAVDYRGFGESRGALPSERTVNEDARTAWAKLTELQPDPAKRLIYGHSLGGAVAVDLAAELGQDAADSGQPVAARGLIIESTFTTLADAAAAVADTSLPIRWIMSQRFDSVGKIEEINMPVLIVHGTDDRYVPARFSEELFAAARDPKQLLLVPGGTHNNSMRVSGGRYQQAIEQLMESGTVPTTAGTTTPRKENAG